VQGPWSIRRESSSLAAFTQAAGFAIGVLEQSQQELTRQFAADNMTLDTIKK